MNLKKYLVLSLAVILAVFMSVEASAKKKVKTAEVTFITTVDCKNCVKKVEANLPFNPGIKDMKVSLEDRTIWLKYDPAKTDVEKLKAAINKLGYEAEPVVNAEAQPAK